MVAVRIIAMSAAQALVNQQGQPSLQRDISSGIQRRVVVRPLGVVRPVQDKFARPGGIVIGERQRALLQFGAEFPGLHGEIMTPFPALFDKPALLGDYLRL